MSKDFRPIFRIEPSQEGDFRGETQKLLEEKRLLEERLDLLERELRAERERRASLSSEVESLKKELEEKEAKIQSLLSELLDAKLKKVLAQKLLSEVEEGLKKAKEELKGEFINFSKEVIKEFLLTDAVPKEELITRLLEEVFERSFELKGEVKLFLNPKDMERAFEFVASVKEKLKDKIEIEVIRDESLEVGEVRVETPKFVIERKHPEIVEEIVQEVLKNEDEGS